MASPRFISANTVQTSERRYRRSSFNGAKQLRVAQAPNRRILGLLILLALALLLAIATIVGLHLQSANESLPSGATEAATHPANP